MKVERQIHSVQFYEECAKYLNEGHSLKETSEKFDVKYATLRQNLTKLGLRTPNRKISAQKCSFNEHYFDVIDSHNKAYFIGLLLSDGYISKTPYSWNMGIALQDSDKYILEKLKEEIESSAQITHYKNSNKLVLTGSEHLIDALKALEFSEDKSHSDYKVPNIPDEYFNSFVRGYFDGDGCITIKATGYSVTSICCNSKIFLDDLNEKLQQHGITDSRVRCETGSRKSPLYVLYISKKENQKQFRDFIYQNDEVKLLRKYEKFMEIPC